MTSKKKLNPRVDELLFSRGLAESRAKAQAMVMAGEVSVVTNNSLQLVKKAGQRVEAECEFEINSLSSQDVGRGAQKLRGAFDAWPKLAAFVEQAECLDIGASTGGFTQVLLEYGAKSVFALDVGTNQLHERLRKDKRVRCVEKQHFLRLEPGFWESHDSSGRFDVIVTDVSFISVTKLVDSVNDVLKDEGHWVLLVKPQFELSSDQVPKGVVREEQQRQKALTRVRLAIEASPGLNIRHFEDCVLPGTKGNREYFLWVQKTI